MSIESRSRQYGVVFDHWQIKEFLGSGSGGKSAVFRLSRTDSTWGESALKVINLIEEKGNINSISAYRRNEYEQAKNECKKSAEQEVRFMDELRGNTNIVDYLDHKFVDWSDETGFGCDMLIRMELLEDLRSKLREGYRYSEKDVLKIGREVCTALVLCHRKEILHRDIKPENIFINSNGNFKLGDFGVSRILSSAPAAFASTGIGTPEYAAPEQFLGHHDKRVDIYSLGLVLYEISNRNRLPFATSSYAHQEDIQKRQMGIPLPKPEGISEGLWHVLRKACAYNAEDRYGTAQEFLEDLCHLDGTKVPEYHKPVIMPLQPNQTVKADEMDVQYGTQKADNWVGENTTQYAVPKGLAQSSSAETVLAEAKEIPMQRSSIEEQRKKKGILAVVFACIAVVLSAALLFLIVGDHEHTWIDATCTAPRTCEECGETEGSALEHNWSDVTCTDARTCERCGETEGNALGHVWTDATCTDPKICSVCQKTEGAALGHQWMDATLTAPKTCLICHETSGETKLTNILTEAEQYAAARKYRLAIELLDNAWKKYGERQFYDLAAKYRTEFGVYNTSLFAAGKYNTVILGSDGRVEICGDNSHREYDAGNWTDIVAISAGDRHVVGLTKNGTVVAEGNDVNDECKVTGWTNIIAISAGDVHTVALSKNGNVYATGYNHKGQCDVTTLTNVAGEKRIVSVAAGYVHTLALLEDGSVVACGGNSNGECNVYGWKDIVAIYAGSEFSAGLKKDGTVVVTGKGTSTWDISTWTDIVNLAAGDYYLIGLKANGDVLSVGVNSPDNPSEGQTSVSGWADIVFVAAGNDHTIAMDSDGTLLCIGSNKYGQCNYHGRVLKR